MEGSRGKNTQKELNYITHMRETRAAVVFMRRRKNPTNNEKIINGAILRFSVFVFALSTLYFFFFSRPGRSQGLLYKHKHRHSLIH